MVGFEGYSLPHPTCCSLCFLKRGENVVSQLPAPATWCHVFPTTMDSIPLELKSKMYASFVILISVWGSLPQQQESNSSFRVQRNSLPDTSGNVTGKKRVERDLKSKGSKQILSVKISG